MFGFPRGSAIPVFLGIHFPGAPVHGPGKPGGEAKEEFQFAAAKFNADERIRRSARRLVASLKGRRGHVDLARHHGRLALGRIAPQDRGLEGHRGHRRRLRDLVRLRADDVDHAGQVQGIQAAIRGPRGQKVEAGGGHDVGQLFASGAAGIVVDVREVVSFGGRDDRRDEGGHGGHRQGVGRIGRDYRQEQNSQERGIFYRQQIGNVRPNLFARFGLNFSRFIH